VATGFEPADILLGMLAAIRQLEAGEARVENVYERAVRAQGNPAAQELLTEVFHPVDREWRGIGVLPQSGLRLTPGYANFDAEHRFGRITRRPTEDSRCIAGLVLQGRSTPDQCPAFGKACTPERPLGVPMVSTEGACAAYYLYRDQRK
jgi:hydrogenase expression/formation protein HypD